MRACSKCGNTFSVGMKFCTSCGIQLEPTVEIKAPIPSAVRTVKNPMSKRAKIFYSITTIALVGFFLTLFIRSLPGKPHPIIEQQPSVAMPAAYAGSPIEQSAIVPKIDNGKIILPLATLLDKKILAFDYKKRNSVIPILLYITTEGKVVTAFRLCEPCNSKMFRIEGDELCCGNCETRWKLNNLEGIQGSCQKYPPDPFPSTVEGLEIRIDEAVVSGWKIRL